MSSEASKFLEEITHATQVVEQMVLGQRTFPEFKQEYGDYYYAAALDGHEGSVPAHLRLQTGEAIRLHAVVQDILDRTYFDPDNSKGEMYKSAGRITPSDAEMQFQRLATRFDIPEILRELKGTRGVHRR
jgi:hypothetical protein